MSKKHDENKDVRLVSRIASVDTRNKTISAPVSTVMGIRVLGRIDYLTHYCGYVFIRDNSARVSRINADDEDKKLPRKREKKQVVSKQPANNKRKR